MWYSAAMTYRSLPPWRTLLLRTEATARAYEARKRQKNCDGLCALCADHDTLEEYTHWRRMPNAYPYDRYFTHSDMLVLKRHSDERGLNENERAELIELKGKLSETYDHFLENLPKQASIPHHYHIHLVTFKHPTNANDGVDAA